MTEEMKKNALNEDQLEGVSGGLTDEEIRRYQEQKEYQRRVWEAQRELDREKEEEAIRQYQANKERMQRYYDSIRE